VRPRTRARRGAGVKAYLGKAPSAARRALGARAFHLGEGGRLENRGEAEKREKERRTTFIAVERTVARLISGERFCRKVPQLCGYLVT
jgi:hypothetical protein